MSFYLHIPETEQPLQLDAAIFDMDGLLVDSEGLATEAWRIILARYNIPLRQKDIDDMFGMRIIEDARLFIAQYAIPQTPEDLVSERRVVMEDLLRQSLKPMPGAVTLVQTLSEHGVPLALATSGAQSHAELCLQLTGLSAYFSLRVTGDVVERGKPAPDIFFMAANLLRIAPEKCLVFEDAPHGAAAGVAAGSPVVCVPCEHTAKLQFPPVTLTARSLLDALAMITFA